LETCDAEYRIIIQIKGTSQYGNFQIILFMTVTNHNCITIKICITILLSFYVGVKLGLSAKGETWIEGLKNIQTEDDKGCSCSSFIIRALQHVLLWESKSRRIGWVEYVNTLGRSEKCL
jgi:hypothetical protein